MTLRKGRFTPDEERYLSRAYARYGPTCCAAKLNRSKNSICEKANRMGLVYGVALPGFVRITDLALESGKNASGLRRLAKRHHVLHEVGTRAILHYVPKGWAEAILEVAASERRAREARNAGYLTTTEVAAYLSVATPTVINGFRGNGSLAALSKSRHEVGERGSYLFHPQDIEKLRARLDHDRAAIKSMDSAKALWVEGGGKSRSASLANHRASRPSRKVLKNGRTQRFFERTA